MGNSRWDRLKESVKERTEEKRETRGGIFKPGLKITQWKPGEGDHEIDVIPYAIGENDPRVVKGEKEAGYDHYVLMVFVHQNVGPTGQDSIICLANTYGKKCPICEYCQELIKNGEKWENYKQFKTSKYRRAIYNVVVYDNDIETAKGVQAWNTSEYLMEMHLAKLASGSQRNKGSYVYFPHPEEGKSIAFTKRGEGRETDFMAHRLLDRNYIISEETLKAAHCLDSLLKIPTYEEVYELFYGEKYNPENATETTDTKTIAEVANAEPEKVATPTRPTRGPRKTEAKPVEEPVRSRGERVITPPKEEAPPVAKVETAHVPEVVDEAITPEDIDSMTRKDLIRIIKEEKLGIDNVEDMETPDIKAAIKKIILSGTEETTPEPEPAPKQRLRPARTASAAKDVCPNGFVFGEACDTTQDCDKCENKIWEACSAKSKELRDAKVKKEPAPTSTTTTTSRFRRR